MKHQDGRPWCAVLLVQTTPSQSVAHHGAHTADGGGASVSYLV